MESPAVENVLRAYEALTVEEKQTVLQRVNLRLFNRTKRTVFRKSVRQNVEQRTGSRKPTTHAKSGNKTALYQGNLIRIDLKAGIVEPNQLWQLEIVAGTDDAATTLRHIKCLDETTLRELLANAPTFYLAQKESNRYLVAYRNELTEATFGVLTEISAFDAVTTFGVANVEEAGEKVYVQLV